MYSMDKMKIQLCVYICIVYLFEIQKACSQWNSLCDRLVVEGTVEGCAVDQYTHTSECVIMQKVIRH